MGMDVHGKAPRSETGKYFRNNVWWWHGLWDYCVLVAPTLTRKVKHGHSNDGDGLDDADSRELAELLRAEIASGRTKALAAARQAVSAALPDERCDLCAGTGTRTDLGPMPDGCNGCQGKGRRRPVETWYQFTEENVAEFATFLADCGGFEIC